jgi:hypothetical protein
MFLTHKSTGSATFQIYLRPGCSLTSPKPWPEPLIKHPVFKDVEYQRTTKNVNDEATPENHPDSYLHLWNVRDVHGSE